MSANINAFTGQSMQTITIGNSTANCSIGSTGCGGAYGQIGSAMSGIIGNPYSTQLSPADAQKIQDLIEEYKKLTGITMPLPPPQPTQEELKELEALEEARQRGIKQQQIDAFKKTPSAIRQKVVDEILWCRELLKIEAVDESKNLRQLELESKKSAASYAITGGAGGYLGGISISSTAGYMWPQPAPLKIPRYLTEDDVINAHNDATLEEECLGQK